MLSPPAGRDGLLPAGGGRPRLRAALGPGPARGPVPGQPTLERPEAALELPCDGELPEQRQEGVFGHILMLLYY